MSIVNKKLEAARMSKRWSVAVASEKAGVSVNTFNRWERGLQVPQLGTLDQLCAAFASSPEELGFAHAVAPRRRRTFPQSLPHSELVMSPDRPPLIVAPSPLMTPLMDAFPAAVMTPYEIHLYFEQAKRSLEIMSQVRVEKDGDEDKSLSRRHAIMTLISTPAGVLGLTQRNNSGLLHPEEILSLCAMSIPLCWQLYFEGGLLEVERILPGYLSQLVMLIQSSPLQRTQAAALASQSCQLASLLALQHQNFGTAHVYVQRSFEYSELANDANLQVASLIRLGQIYLYLKRPVQRLLAYERALQYIDGASPLLQGRVHIGLAEAHGHLRNEREAQQFLARAHATYPTQCEEDPNFAYTHFNRLSLYSFEGLMYLHLRQPRQAWELFRQVDKQVPDALVPNRVELTVRQAATSYALNDRDRACQYVETAITQACAVSNQLRYDEAFTIYEHMRTRWSGEKCVKKLGDLFLS